jgi:hypothetical protein
MTDDVVTVSAGETDVTVQVCGNEIELGITDDVEAMYGSLDADDVETLIAALTAALAQLRR